MSDPIVKWPFGDATVEVLAATGVLAINIVNEMTIIDGASTIATGNRTINLTVSPNVGIGAMIVLKAKTTAVETMTFGTKMLGAVITGVAGKTKATTFIYDGTNFINAGTPIQLD